jgi:hypothetical protein
MARAILVFVFMEKEQIPSAGANPFYGITSWPLPLLADIVAKVFLVWRTN